MFNDKTMKMIEEISLVTDINIDTVATVIATMLLHPKERKKIIAAKKLTD